MCNSDSNELARRAIRTAASMNLSPTSKPKVEITYLFPDCRTIKVTARSQRVQVLRRMCTRLTHSPCTCMFARWKIVLHGSAR
ncbi:hypothetical protein AHF37_09783 [Paragonimus kellicotti]|nr:hypothetical protein AHF37_09783 [Paragonimus kellicotti]